MINKKNYYDYLIKNSYLIILISIFFAQLLLLWIGRGSNIVGWETLGAVDGAITINENNFFDTFKVAWQKSRDFQCWNSTNSIIFSLIPGYLHSLKPFLFWAQLTTLTFSVFFILLCTKITSLNKKILFISILTSPAILSHLIIGYPYLSSIGTFSLALVYVYSDYVLKKTIKSNILDLIIWLSIFELSFHCYELAKTVFIIPLFAGIFFSRISKPKRFIWIIISIAFGYYTLQFGRCNVEAFTITKDLSYFKIIDGIKRFFDFFFISQYADFPFLITLGTISAFAIRKDKWFWRSIIFSQFILVFWLAVQNDYSLRPRRTLLLLFLCALINAWAWQDIREKKIIKRFFITILITGMLCSLLNSFFFFNNPTRKKSLPYTQSQADFFPKLDYSNEAHAITEIFKKSKKKQILFYGADNLAENSTDPTGFLERIFLELSYKEYSENIYSVANIKCRFLCLPSVLSKNNLKLEKEISNIDGSFVYFSKESQSDNFKNRFFNKSKLTEVELNLPHFTVYQIDKYNPSQFVFVDKLQEVVPSTDISNVCNASLMKVASYNELKKVHSQKRLKLKNIVKTKWPLKESFKKPISKYFYGYGYNHSKDNKTYSIKGAVDDAVLILINDQVVLESPKPKAKTKFLTKVRIPPGQFKIEVLYYNFMGIGVLNLELLNNENEVVSLGCTNHTKNK